jgi:hypothetical protein
MLLGGSGAAGNEGNDSGSGDFSDGAAMEAGDHSAADDRKSKFAHRPNPITAI